MRPLALMLSIAVLVVLTAGCTERNNGNAVPAKGPDPALVAKTSEPSASETAEPSKGREVYEANNCMKCHRVDAPGAPPGRGRGPNLTKVGAKRSADWIAAARPQSEDARRQDAAVSGIEAQQ